MSSDLVSRTEMVLEWRREGHTFKEIGLRLGVTRQRATQLWQRAICPEVPNVCWCGVELLGREEGRHGPLKKYCSEGHRPRAPSERRRSATACRVCGVEYGEVRKSDVCRECQRAYRQRRVKYVELAELQGHLCAICGRPEVSVGKFGEPRRLAIDHCHQTGAVRELLCMRCNTMLGSAEDDPARLERAAAYLRRHRVDRDAA